MRLVQNGFLEFKRQAFTRSPIQIQINNKTIIEFGSQGYEKLLRPRFVLSAWPSASAVNTNLCLSNSSYRTRSHLIIIY